MIQEIIDSFLSKGNLLITAPTGNGSTVLSLALVNSLLKEDKTILYYSSNGIDREYIKEHFKKVYKDVLFLCGTLTSFVNYLIYTKYDYDVLVVDPGDTLMYKKEILNNIYKLARPDSRIIATSQIRQDPTKGGDIYSPLELLNKSYDIFKYSLWIRDITENEALLKSRYIDVFEGNRVGNKYTRRYILRFDQLTGVLVE